MRAWGSYAGIGAALILGAVLPGAGWGVSPDPWVRVRTAEGIQVVPLETYVLGAVAAEVYASWPRESLRAQAVVARTYALHERDRRRSAGAAFDVEDSVISQRYVLGEVSGSIRRAVRDTRGQVLMYGGRPLLAAFHASAGGRTASAEEVWGTSVPYLRPVAGMDDDAPDFFWSYEIRLHDLSDALRAAGYETGTVARVRILERSRSGRVKRLKAGEALLSGRDLRSVLGGRAIRSSLFEVRQEQGRVRFLGSGAGHGVGLSQWGARSLAERDWGYHQILDHYYPGSRLVSLGPPGPDRQAGYGGVAKGASAGEH